MVRLFVAVDPPATARDHLAARLRELSQHRPPRQDMTQHVVTQHDLSGHDPSRHDNHSLRWTPPEQWHLTLAFLADVPDSEVPTLSANLACAAHALTGFPAGLAGAGAFPRPARATTLWCGVDSGRPELEAVAAAAATAARATGLPLDHRPFRPHLTIARCSPTDLQSIVTRLADYRGPRFPVEEITLVRSHLGNGPGGRTVHEVIDRWALATA